MANAISAIRAIAIMLVAHGERTPDQFAEELSTLFGTKRLTTEPSRRAAYGKLAKIATTISSQPALPPDDHETTTLEARVAQQERQLLKSIELKTQVKLLNLKPLADDCRRLLAAVGAHSLLSFYWSLPRIESDIQLARWLDLERRELDWLADLQAIRHRGLTRRRQHYVYTWIRKRSNGWRLIESPKTKLKRVQRRLLSGLFDLIPVHPNSHGFCRGHNVATYIAPHCGQASALAMDLQDFFPSIHIGRVQGLLRRAGYRDEVAFLIASLSTTVVPDQVLEKLEHHLGVTQDNCIRAGRTYRRRHLPQGSPCSPAIANAVAYRLDQRLTGLAESVGAVYSRYADDLLFSGRSSTFSSTAFATTVGAIAIEEGFQVNFRKTRVMHASQRQVAAGVVFNQKLNVARDEFDSLKAILFNAQRSGLASQNRNQEPRFIEHLRGRIEWVRQLNPSRGAKLLALWEKVNELEL